MRAYVLKRHGDLDALEFEPAWPVPKVGPKQVLVKVAACGMNNTDINTRVGWYSKSVGDATSSDGFELDDAADNTWGGDGVQFPRIQGADVAGTVVAAGSDAPVDLVGKRVISDNWLRDWRDPLNKAAAGYLGSEADGGFAEYCVLDHRNVGVITCDMTDAEIATFSCSYSTAEGMLNRAAAGPDDTVLVAGASGGVGSALVQLAKHRDCTVVAMASEAKHDAVAAFGADHLLGRSPEDLPGALAEATGSPKVSVVADVVGGPYFPTIIDALERGGRYVTSGAIAGPMVDLDLRTLYLMDLTLHGSTVVPPHVFTDLVGYINRREIQPVVAATYPLEDLKTAQQAFVEKAHVGNLVIEL